MPRSNLSRLLVGAALTALVGVGAVTPASAATTPPVITWQSQIAAGATYAFGEVPAVVPTCTAVDDLGAVPCSVTGYSTEVGTHVLTATAVSLDGLFTATETRSYTVAAWELKGFYRPVKMGAGVWNKVKGGATVPLKFKVYVDGDKSRSAAVVASLTAQQVTCDATAAPIGAPVPITSAKKGFQLKYRDGAFHQNWKTTKVAKAKPAKKAPATTVCQQVTLTTQDGSTLTALFTLR